MYENVKVAFDTLPEFLDYFGKLFPNSETICPAGWSWAMYDYFFTHLKIKGFTFLGQGSYRMCYRKDGRNWVIKIPKNKKGSLDCRTEAAMFKHRKGKLNPIAPDEYQGALAPCRLKTISGVSCLIMPYLEGMRLDYKSHPDWTKQLADGPQIGKTRRGKIVVYDYANEGDGWCEWTAEDDAKLVKRANDRLEHNVLKPKRESEKKKQLMTTAATAAAATVAGATVATAVSTLF